MLLPKADSGGKPAAVQMLREISERPGNREASGLRVLQHRSIPENINTRPMASRNSGMICSSEVGRILVKSRVAEK
jgi:hypothetical protein